jgi:chromosome transmission fidelity protein 1
MNDDVKAGISQVNSLLHALETGDRNGRFILSESELKYVCTDVVEFMSDIIEQCRSVIFCGGTMSPLSELIKQLITPSLQIRSDSKSLDHVIDAENINLSLLMTGPTGLSLNFSYESRMITPMIRELGMIITNYARIIPAGLVVFFTSFDYMDHVIELWKSWQIFSGFEAIKKVQSNCFCINNRNIFRFLSRKKENYLKKCYQIMNQ